MLIRIRTTLTTIPLRVKSITHIIMDMVIRIITEERLPITFFKLPKNEHLSRQRELRSIPIDEAKTNAGKGAAKRKRINCYSILAGCVKKKIVSL